MCVLRWYHGRIERRDAEKLLMESENVDSFLVRESVTHPGDYTIVVRCHDNNIMHIRVDYKVRAQHNDFQELPNVVLQSRRVEVSPFDFDRAHTTSY